MPVINGTSGDDLLPGTDGNDTINGLEGNDTIIGMGGDDSLYGGDGDHDQLEGGLGNDLLDGGAGTNDTASYWYPSTGVTVDLTISGPQDTGGAGIDTLVGIESLSGTNFADTLIGNDLANQLSGNGGADILKGLGGNDDYYIDDLDTVIELADGGIDAVHALNMKVYHLPDNVENLQVYLSDAGTAFAFGNDLNNRIAIDAWVVPFSATMYGAGGDDELVGGPIADALFGEDGNDDLHGREGDDFLNAGAGDNSLYGDEGNDLLLGSVGNEVLSGGPGVDTASYENATSGVTVSLGATPSGGVSNSGDLQDTGGGGIDRLFLIENLIGSDHNDILKGLGTIVVGGALGSVLDGRGGDDWLLGSTGFDTLIGGAGSDVLQGGYGNDVYVITDSSEHASAEINDNGFDGEFDEVRYTADAADTLRLFAGDTGIESVRISDQYGVTTGTGALNIDARAIGNALYLTGNDGANILRATAFDDHLNGNGGDDYLAGYAGNDTLTGGAGIDRMYGGTGDDTYFVSDATDYTYENAGEGHDTVISSVDHQLRANVEGLLLADGAQIGRGNELDNHIAGTDGANRLYGDAGNDTLIAKDGDDLLYGGAGNDTLEGDGGYDKMIGGLGDDTYIVTDATDIVYENAGEGTDKVVAFVTHILRANIEQLELSGAGDIRGYGNDLDNLIIGNFGNNLIYGRGGSDTISGGDGNDLLYGENGNDTIEGGSGSDRFYGGAGADTFLFRDGDFGGLTSANADRLMDFDEAQGDVLDLANVDANTLLGGDQAFTFIGSAAFGHHAGELRAFQSGSTTWVQGDTNGDGNADFLIRVDGLHTLTTADFVL